MQGKNHLIIKFANHSQATYPNLTIEEVYKTIKSEISTFNVYKIILNNKTFDYRNNIINKEDLIKDLRDDN